MIDFLLQHPALIAMTTLLLAALLGQAWLYRQLRQGTRLLQATLRTSQALQADKQQAEEASRIKSRFLGNIGHEIRTPLNALIGLLELVLQRTQAQDPNRSSIELALGAAGDLRELLADLLDVTRIESGQMSLAPDWTRLRDCVDSVMSIFLILARQKHLELNLEYQVPDPEPLVLIDALRFKQVLSNLLSNAIKFTHRGEVRVRLQLVPGKHPSTSGCACRCWTQASALPNHSASVCCCSLSPNPRLTVSRPGTAPGSACPSAITCARRWGQPDPAQAQRPR